MVPLIQLFVRDAQLLFIINVSPPFVKTSFISLYIVIVIAPHQLVNADVDGWTKTDITSNDLCELVSE